MTIKKLSNIFREKGGLNTGMIYIIVIILLMFGFAFVVTGPNPSQIPILKDAEVVIGNPNTKNPDNKQLQLFTFSGATITPPTNFLCQPGGDNNHPEIIIAYSPAHAKAVSTDGQIKIWVSDTAPLKIARGEIVNRNSGIVTKPGDRTARAPDSYLWEPALYVFPDTVDRSGKPYFPKLIKGDYDNGKPMISYGIEQLPADAKKPNGYVVEYVWNVSDLGLTEGEYQLQFIIHDGHNGRAIGCITIRVYEPKDPNREFPL